MPEEFIVPRVCESHEETRLMQLSTTNQQPANNSAASVKVPRQELLRPKSQSKHITRCKQLRLLTI